LDRAQILAGVIGAAVLAACSGPRPLTVASKNFTEQLILGEILAQHLEHRLATPVDRKLNLGGTLLTHGALAKGEIDLYPEYTGTALTAILKLPPSSDAAAVLDEVRREYRRRWNVEWLDPLGFNNTFAMAIRGEDARRLRLDTLSDASRRAPGWILGAGYEFQQRPDGLEGLLKTYRLPLRGAPRYMDLGLLYKALEQRQVEMIAANATDGMLSVMDLQVLRDDKQYFPPYEAAVLVRRDALERHPGLREALMELSGKFTDQTMQRLNHQVDGEKRPIAEVAAGFLREAALRR
jgi:osmoprotectant transport system substrate-binding protein